MSPATHSTPVTDWPRMRSHVYGHGNSDRGGVGTSTLARTVTGVRAGRYRADSSTLLPLTARSRQAAPMPKPTEHWARGISPGSVIEMSAR